ncbi:hypothetical protein GF327_08610 [Candidatus Woesearchaeota archaeon]|nr:hypothetical protein [Candidatus Woesearchaeota archaeon]
MELYKTHGFHYMDTILQRNCKITPYFDASIPVETAINSGKINQLTEEWKGDSYLEIFYDPKNSDLSVNFIYLIEEKNGQNIIHDISGTITYSYPERIWDQKYIDRVISLMEKIKEKSGKKLKIGYGSIIFQEGRDPIFSAY